MKTLYVSDLDGTLMNRSAELSDNTVEKLNKLIASEVNFSVATARTAATCERILERVNINVPIILMNGVLIYSLPDKKYIKKEILSPEKTEAIVTAMKSSGITGFMYGLTDDRLTTCYEFISNRAMKDFMDERVQKYGKVFTKVPDLSVVETEVIYFCFIDSRENIHTLYDLIKNIPGLKFEKYEDIYSDEGLWYMEVFNETASKYNAVRFLRNQFGFDIIVAFGDNLNDIPMFEASDVAVAVGNAKDEVKARADAVIGANVDDSVVGEIERRAAVERKLK